MAEQTESDQALGAAPGDVKHATNFVEGATASSQSEDALTGNAEESEVMTSQPHTISETISGAESNPGDIDSQAAPTGRDNSLEKLLDNSSNEVTRSPSQAFELQQNKDEQVIATGVPEKINKDSTGGEESAKFSDDEISIGSESSTTDSSSDSSSDSESDPDSEDSETRHSDAKDNLEEEDEPPSGPIVSKNEIDEKPHVLPADYKVPEEAPLEYIGDITALVERSVVIKACVSGEFRILKENSILCFEDRQVLGPLYETFGKLQSPVYRVLLNSAEELAKFEDKKGSKVFYVVPDSQFILTDSIKKMKGTDASNCHDEELPEDEQEFSDDEQELARKQEKLRKKQQKKQGQDGEPPKKRLAKEDTFSSYGFAAPKAQTQLRPVAYKSIYQHDVQGARAIQNARNTEASGATSLYNEPKSNTNSQLHLNGPDFHYAQNTQPIQYHTPNGGFVPQYNQAGYYALGDQYQRPAQPFQPPAPSFNPQGNLYGQQYQPNMAYGTYPAQPQYQPYNQQMLPQYHQHPQFTQSNSINFHGLPQAGWPPEQVVSPNPAQNESAQGISPHANLSQSNAALHQLHQMVSSQLSHKKPEEDAAQ